MYLSFVSSLATATVQLIVILRTDIPNFYTSTPAKLTSTLLQTNIVGKHATLNTSGRAVIYVRSILLMFRNVDFMKI